MKKLFIKFIHLSFEFRSFTILSILVLTNVIDIQSQETRKVDERSLMRAPLPDPKKKPKKDSSKVIKEEQNSVSKTPEKQVRAVDKNKASEAKPIASSTAEKQAKQGSTHTVQAKETVYSIAKKYNLTVEQLLQINKMSAPNLRVGQVLTVTGGVAKKDSTKPKPVVSVPKQPIYVSEGSDLNRVYEKGVAIVIETKAPKRRFLALSKNAPIGSTIQVKNLANNKHINAKVIGRMSPSVGEHVVVQLSVNAYDFLDSKDRQCAVEVNYLKSGTKARTKK